METTVNEILVAFNALLQTLFGAFGSATTRTASAVRDTIVGAGGTVWRAMPPAGHRLTALTIVGMLFGRYGHNITQNPEYIRTRVAAYMVVGSVLAAGLFAGIGVWQDAAWLHVVTCVVSGIFLALYGLRVGIAAAVLGWGLFGQAEHAKAFFRIMRNIWAGMLLWNGFALVLPYHDNPGAVTILTIGVIAVAVGVPGQNKWWRRGFYGACSSLITTGLIILQLAAIKSALPKVRASVPSGPGTVAGAAAAFAGSKTQDSAGFLYEEAAEDTWERGQKTWEVLPARVKDPMRQVPPYGRVKVSWVSDDTTAVSWRMILQSPSGTRKVLQFDGVRGSATTDEWAGADNADIQLVGDPATPVRVTLGLAD